MSAIVIPTLESTVMATIIATVVAIMTPVRRRRMHFDVRRRRDITHPRRRVVDNLRRRVIDDWRWRIIDTGMVSMDWHRLMDMAYGHRATVIVADRRAQNGAKNAADDGAILTIDGIADDRAGAGADQCAGQLIGGRRGGTEGGQARQQNDAED